MGPISIRNYPPDQAPATSLESKNSNSAEYCLGSEDVGAKPSQDRTRGRRHFLRPAGHHGHIAPDPPGAGRPRPALARPYADSGVSRRRLGRPTGLHRPEAGGPGRGRAARLRHRRAGRLRRSRRTHSDAGGLQPARPAGAGGELRPRPGAGLRRGRGPPVPGGGKAADAGSHARHRPHMASRAVAGGLRRRPVPLRRDRGVLRPGRAGGRRGRHAQALRGLRPGAGANRRPAVRPSPRGRQCRLGAHHPGNLPAGLRRRRARRRGVERHVRLPAGERDLCL